MADDIIVSMAACQWTQQYDGPSGISESVSRRLREEVLKIGYGRKRVLLFALTGVLVGVLVIVAF
ncbi:MAG: hypothetical protein ACYCXJ_06665, partial [Thermoleophilia bacterium]